MRSTTRGSLSFCAWRRTSSSLEMVALFPFANVGRILPIIAHFSEYVELFMRTYIDIGRTLFAIQRVVTPKDLRLAAVQQLSGDHQPITCWMPLKAHVEFIGLGAIEQVPLTMCRRPYTRCRGGQTMED